MYLIVGLGNPGEKYSRMYHNLGFMALDILAGKLGFKKFKNKGYMAETAEGSVNGERVILAKPATFMNLSGDCVKSLLAAHRAPLENLLVVYDDVDIPKGSVRLRASGSAGTHNGMKNIVERLRTTDFKRVRVGAGPVPEFVPLIDYVLSDIRGESMKLIEPALLRAADAAAEFAAGVEWPRVMNAYNG
ncbi:MAG: aminoacyl-tRNA hydrolase [Clostridiales bacterium]|jgi:PTH1 family peptidyl-tRNA hydrolase|nr:aminoacyl-tRNA hydrolase [Clostridiales bacterium]